ncbi:MAG: T9SS type A sorting domain-containing protein [Bacteroidota bacterium]
MKSGSFRKIIAFILSFISLSPVLIAQSNIRDSLLFQNRQRQYIVHLPPAYNDQEPLALVIVLHGGSGNLNSVQNFTNMNPVSNANRFLVLYPQGFGPSGMGGFTWADGRGTSADKLGIDDVGFINHLLDQVIQDFAVDESRIYLCGFSNGGFLTQKIACQMNERLAAIASLGSSQGVDQILSCNPERPLPTLILTGTADPLVPYEGGPMEGDVPDVISSRELLDFWIQNNACRNELDSLNLPDTDTTDNSNVSVFEWDQCDCEAKVKHLRINGGGHTWPGVELENVEVIGGETNEDIQASVELWKFFRDFQLCTDLVTSVEGPILATPQVEIFPNPSQETVLIKSSTEILRIELVDLRGQVIVSQDANQSLFGLDLQDVSAGTYFLKMKEKGGQEYAKVLLVE